MLLAANNASLYVDGVDDYNIAFGVVFPIFGMATCIITDGLAMVESLAWQYS